jgi:hypothetical protein
MASEPTRDPDLEWLDHVRPVGLVVAPVLLKELGLAPERQTQAETAVVAEHVGADSSEPVFADPWPFFADVLGWEPPHIAGSPGGPPLPDDLSVRLPQQDTVLSPTGAVRELGDNNKWQLLVRIEAPGIDPDARNTFHGWEASAHQRFERLLRETEIFAGILITEKKETRDGEDRYTPELRLVYAPHGETSGHLTFPLRALATVAGRPMLGGLKLLLDAVRLFTDADDRRLPALLKRSREAQAAVSTALAEQVLGALHELLRGLDAADAAHIRELSRTRPHHIYEGLLTVLLRLVFILYAEDRDLLPSRTDGRAREIYETSYSVRGLYATLTEDAALNPDTMDERRGGWGRLLALFRLIHKGHPTRLVQARGGKLFDPAAFPFLEGRADPADPPRVLPVSDGCCLRILEGLMTLKTAAGRERLSYRTLDVEQIGSVYETIMGFTVETAASRVLAIRAGKHNRTPVFVDLEKLVALKGKERIKYLKEDANRGQLSANVTKAVEAAKTVAEMAAALDPIVDERGSPRKHAAAAGTPILQPTDERRRTGSHYTPRSLTEPIVRHALEPAFERLGPDARPEQILDLKVCDPAMGSGAFLVEACRALATRLIQAWTRWPESKPTIPPDEDEDLHARRLVAQRCLYGVDKNPLATDLAKLSLWLATLARDHEFEFLDHALKSGDSLVGLTSKQIAAAHWDETKPGLPLFRQLVRDRISEAMTGRAEIQLASDETTRAIQEARHRVLKERIKDIRLIGDAVIAAFFAAETPTARETKRAEIESWLSGFINPTWDKLRNITTTLKKGAHPLNPFHWDVEFPEVFARATGGFDAVAGNPPFLGGKRISTELGTAYLDWLLVKNVGAHGNADLVAHFFRRAHELLRKGGALGLLATNSISQGDTRASSLESILKTGSSIFRAIRRLQWPGEAAVVVSVVHIVAGIRTPVILDAREVTRISAYLVEGTMDGLPARLASNERQAFNGTKIYGQGFTFDDETFGTTTASSIREMTYLISEDPHNVKRISPYIGGDELSNDPRQSYHRYVIDFFDRPLGRRPMNRGWEQMTEPERARCFARGLMPFDYPGEVAEDWPRLLEIVRRNVKPERDAQKRKALRERWWQFGDRRPGLYSSAAGLTHVVATTAHSPHLLMTRLSTGMVFAHSLIVFPHERLPWLAVLQSRPHETWVRFFASTLEDRLRYTPSDCFETFPFSDGFESSVALEHAGTIYHDHRAALMIARNEGLTKTYNRFHERGDASADIVRLRELHSEIDRAVLRAYGWDDLADRAEPIFLDGTNEDEHTYQGRLFWPSDFRDEVLARLLALNAKRHDEEVRLGIAPGMKGKVREEEDEL